MKVPAYRLQAPPCTWLWVACFLAHALNSLGGILSKGPSNSKGLNYIYLEGEGGFVGITRATIPVIGVINLLARSPRPSKYGLE